MIVYCFIQTDKRTPSESPHLFLTLTKHARIRATKGIGDGKHVFMALHKGMDGFMSDDTYEHFYWRHLKEIIDETKRIFDACAPGGGFIFETACGLDYCSHENVEAMFDTVRNYGKH